MNELELMRLSRPDPEPSPDTVAKHFQGLTRAIEAAAASGSEHPRASVDPAGHSPAEGPSEPVLPVGFPNRWTRPLAAATALVLAGLAVGVLRGGDDEATRVLTAPPDAQGATTTHAATAATGVVPCGSRLPGPIPEGPRVHDPNEMAPETVSVRIYACRTHLSTAPTLPNGQPMATTLGELIERFGGLEGSVIDEFGKTHQISLAPLADADRDTTLVGLLWSGRPRNAPPPPSDLSPQLTTSQSLEPPWINAKP